MATVSESATVMRVIVDDEGMPESISSGDSVPGILVEKAVHEALGLLTELSPHHLTYLDLSRNCRTNNLVVVISIKRQFSAQQ